MTLKQYFKRALSLPPHVVLLKVYQLLMFRIKSYWLQFVDTILTTYSSNKTGHALSKIFPKAPDAKSIREMFPELESILNKTLNHEFDLLGSGWTKVYYGLEAKGILGLKYNEKPIVFPKPQDFQWISTLINKPNRKSSEKAWENISKDYAPIDWHIDFKSGYRWDSNTWWFRVPYGHKPGVDIKVPWEITRAQHMPWLALGYGMYLNEKNLEKAESLSLEFQNQLLDFIATNPPKYGVNWRCAMDVAIRAANWILTYDLFRNYGWEPSDEVKKILSNSLYDHGEFIFANLEIGTDKFRGNHYLADICGLAYISAFLPESKTVDNWFIFSHKALIEEMDYQFFDDGANFEGSTAYHRLSAEMMLYTTLMFENISISKRQKLPSQLFNQKFYQKLFSMQQFSETITRPDAIICQIGDNDSGRFFKIQPDFIPGTIEENHLSQKNLISLIGAFFKKNQDCLNSKWIYEISQFNSQVTSAALPQEINNIHKFKNVLPEDIINYLNEAYTTQELQIPTEPLNQIIQTIPLQDSTPTKVFIFKDFGMYTWKADNFFMTFRCGLVGQKERGGHDHNDQLSIELITPDLKMEDPGTGIYTPFPNIRNKYRSAASHFAPQVFKKDGTQIEPGDLNQGLFALRSDQGSDIIIASNTLLAGYNKKLMTVRVIMKKGRELTIKDICLNRDWRLQQKSLDHAPIFSKGYGFH